MNSYETKAHRVAYIARKEAIAKKIWDGIQNLYNSSHSKKRWIWELIQNAHDVCEDSNLEIEIEEKSDSLVFKHNGQFFTMKNIIYLIEQSSSKKRSHHRSEGEERNQTIGKYGTGFLTTHLLSKKVKIKSIFKDKDSENVYKRFTLKLNRDGKDLEEIYQKVKKSLKVFKKLDTAQNLRLSEISALKGKCNTTFIYAIENEESRKALKEGIESLKTSLPYVFAFSEKLSKLTIITDQGSIVYSKTVNQSTSTLARHTISCNSEKRYILTKEMDDVMIAIEMEKINNIRVLKKKDPILPTYFVYLPLIGSEKIKLPFVVHSRGFIPNEPRNDILFDEGDLIEVNRDFMSRAFNLYRIFFKQIVDLDRIHYFCHFPSNSSPQNNPTWMDQQLNEVREFLADQPIVLNSSGEKISLRKMIFVFEKDIKTSLHLSKLMKPLVPDVPQIDEEYYAFWKEFFNLDWRLLDVNRRQVEVFLQKIEQCRNVDELKKYFGHRRDKCFEFLNKVYSICRYNKEYINYSVLPNQNENLRKSKDLFCDDHIKTLLKDVAKDLGNDFREILLNKKMDCQLYLWKTNQELIDYINEKLKINHVEQICKFSSLIPQNSLYREKREAIAKMVCELYKREEGVVDMKDNQINDTSWVKCDEYLQVLIFKKLKKIKSITDLENHGIADPYTFILNLLKYFRPPQDALIYPNNNNELHKLEHLKLNRIIIDLEIKKYQNPSEICNQLIELKSLYSEDLNKSLIHNKISNDVVTRNQYSLSDIIVDIEKYLSDENNYKKDHFKKVYSILQSLAENYKFYELSKFQNNQPTMFFAMLDKKEQNFIAVNFKDPNFMPKYEMVKDIPMDKLQTFSKILNDPAKLALFESLMNNSASNSESVVQGPRKKTTEHNIVMNSNLNSNSALVPAPVPVPIKINDQSSARNFVLNREVVHKQKIPKSRHNLSSILNFKPLLEEPSIEDNITEKSVGNVINTLKKLGDYKIIGEINKVGIDRNIIRGFSYNSKPIEIVAKPNDDGSFIIKDRNEIRCLKKDDNQLWVDDGASPPSKFSLGHIIECNFSKEKPIKTNK